MPASTFAGRDLEGAAGHDSETLRFQVNRTISYTASQMRLQGQSLTVTPLTVTVGYSDTLSETKTITNRFQAVRVTNMRLQ